MLCFAYIATVDGRCEDVIGVRGKVVVFQDITCCLIGGYCHQFLG
jgi:hypothetical protein